MLTHDAKQLQLAESRTRDAIGALAYLDDSPRREKILSLLRDAARLLGDAFEAEFMAGRQTARQP